MNQIGKLSQALLSHLNRVDAVREIMKVCSRLANPVAFEGDLCDHEICGADSSAFGLLERSRGTS